MILKEAENYWPIFLATKISYLHIAWSYDNQGLEILQTLLVSVSVLVAKKFVVLLSVTKSVQTHQKAVATKLNARSLQRAVLQHLIQVVALQLQTKANLRLAKVSLN